MSFDQSIDNDHLLIILVIILLIFVVSFLNRKVEFLQKRMGEVESAIDDLDDNVMRLGV